MRTQVISIVLLLSSLSLLAQDTRPFKDRLYFGGNFGVSFGSTGRERLTTLDISPVVGYKFTDRFMAGPGLVYQYVNYQDKLLKINLNFNNYGAKVFGRYRITESLFAHTELEELSREFFEDNTSKRVNVFSFLVGGGYRQMLGSNSSIDLLVLFNLNDNRFSPYPNPIIRAGFGIGF